jgi:hypothetical protein
MMLYAPEGLEQAGYLPALLALLAATSWYLRFFRTLHRAKDEGVPQIADDC